MRTSAQRLMATLAGLFLLLPAEQGRGRPTDSSLQTARYLVQLRDPPLVRYTGGLSGLAVPPRNARGRLDCDSPAARRYLTFLQREQRTFESELLRQIPDAEVHWRYRVLWNGLAVKVRRNAAWMLRRLPHVRAVWSTDRQWFRPGLDASVPIVGAPVFWSAVGGAANAGRGVKVAVVDTGIDVDNPFFQDPQLTLPAGFPRGATAYTTTKVIAARAYFRPDDPVNTDRDEPNPRDHLGHGSHVAGIIAGANGTVFDIGGYQAPVSGVAPAAWLMSYKVFYRAESGSEGAHEPELMAAFEDAVLDGADVINNSWGGADVFGDADPSLEVYANAVEAGVVVVFAAGNEGPGDGSVGAPGQYHRFITVANASTGRAFTQYLEVTAPTPVDPDLQDIRMTVGRISADFDGDFGPWPIRSSHLVDGGSNENGCGAFSPGAFDGAIALVLRGDCLFTEKAEHAADASALAIVVQNDDPSENPFAMGGQDAPIPGIMIRWDDGNLLRSWIEDHSDAEVVFREGYVPYDTDTLNQVVYSSSRGPTTEGRLKPELAAPGSPILSAEAHRVGSSATEPWDWKSGTSMAAPHVSGAAALLVQSHPTWSHDEIKAALVGTATREGVTSWVGPAAARPDETGAGRLRVDRLLDVRLLSEPPVIDGLEAEPGAAVTATLHLSRVESAVTAVTLHWDPRDPLGAILVEPATDAVAPLDEGGEGELILTFTVPAGTAPGDYTGWLDLQDDDGGSTVVPYHLRVMPESREKDLLIVDLAYAEENETVDVAAIYADVADSVGLTWDRADRESLYLAPSLPELFRYRAVLVVTGDDHSNNNNLEAQWTLDRLSSYLLRGGRLILAGQGPLLGVDHDRFVALVGSSTVDHRPLWDEDLQQLRTQSEYRVVNLDDPRLVTADITLDASATQGDLTWVGEQVPVALDAEREPWGYPVLRLTEGDVQAGGQVAMVYDPFAHWGEDRLAEAHRHRAVVLGFGLEVIKDPDPGSGSGPTPGSRAELLQRAWTWVSDRVSMDVQVEQSGLELTLTVNAVADSGPIDRYTYEFGDGSDRVRTLQDSWTHTYERYDQYEVTVYAQSETGAAEVWRQMIDVQPATPAVDGGLTDAMPAADASRDATRIGGGGGGCHCQSDGQGRAGDGLLALGLLLMSLWIRRRRHAR